MDLESVHENVKDYYGKRLQKTADLQENACLSASAPKTKAMRQALASVHEEVTKKYYGCGLVIPENLNGMKVLDLGSGSGRDCFAVSKLVGQNGSVVGIDMTDEQLEVARNYIEYHTHKFGYSSPNIRFIKGYIENLTAAGLKENEFDIIISNCVINLSPDKRAVLSEAFKVLKFGGEIYFSDVYADRDIPEEARKHSDLWGECISGALWWKELVNLADSIGFSKPRLVTASAVVVSSENYRQILGDAKFVSATFRLFKLPDKKEKATNVIYRGEVPGYENELMFDHQVTFKAGDVVPVSGEMASILKMSRFIGEFDFQPSSKCSPVCCQPDSVMSDPFEFLAKMGDAGLRPMTSCCSSKKCC